MAQSNGLFTSEKVFVIPVTVIDDNASHTESSSNLDSATPKAPESTVLESVITPAQETVRTADSSLSTPVKTRRPALTLLFSKLSTLTTVIIATTALLLVGSKLAGFRAFTVMSGSMEPEYPVGSMIFVKPTNYKSLKIGDVISFVANSDKTIVTHRIVDIKIDPADSEVYRFRTQGDANASPDANLVHNKNVLGTPVLVIPGLGYLAYYLQQPPGLYIALCVGTLLLAWTFLPGPLEERRKTARNPL
ncbi:signal peptidase I [Candidatus Saccharibacteria bacterium]|nr:signal peptidase I [Candidatus Saccharibacteria bacterium]